MRSQFFEFLVHVPVIPIAYQQSTYYDMHPLVPTKNLHVIVVPTGNIDKCVSAQVESRYVPHNSMNVRTKKAS